MVLIKQRDSIKAASFQKSSKTPSDPFEESVYRVIPELVLQAIKPALYRSKFSSMAKQEYVTGTKPTASMGPLKVKVNPPTEFLKKHSKEPQLPQRKLKSLDLLIVV